jgi:hypothetical protein
VDPRIPRAVALHLSGLNPPKQGPYLVIDLQPRGRVVVHEHLTVLHVSYLDVLAPELPGTAASTSDLLMIT